MKKFEQILANNGIHKNESLFFADNTEVTIGEVIDYVDEMNTSNQQKVRDTCVRITEVDGDLMSYVRFLAAHKSNKINNYL